MKSLSRAVCALAVFAMAWSGVPRDAGAQAVAGAQPLMLILDVDQLQKQSRAMQGLRQQVETQRAAFEREVKAQENELRIADEDLRRQRAVLAEPAFTQKVQEFQQRVNQLRESAGQKNQSLQRGIVKAEREWGAVVEEIVRGIAGERRANLVLPRAAVLYFEPGAFDITDDTLRRLDQRLPSMTLALDNTATPRPPQTSQSKPKTTPAPKADPAQQKKN